MNQLHAHVALLDHVQLPTIHCAQGRGTLRRWADEVLSSSDPLVHLQGQVVHQLARLVLTYDEIIRDLERELERLAAQTAPSLLTLNGAAALITAKIVGEVGDIQRFASAAKFASYCGVAPVEASSGERIRHRLSRRGNRKLNSALHMIAIVQRHWDPRAQSYLDRKLAEGKTRKEALRCLKRHLANTVFRLLLRDAPGHQDSLAHAA